MIKFKIILLLLPTLLISPTSSAEEREFTFGQTFNPGGFIRIEGTGGTSRGIVRLDSETKAGRVWFQAAAMYNYRYADERFAPWVHLEFTDAMGNVLIKEQVGLATIFECGGYRDHSYGFSLNLSTSQLERITGVTASMGGSQNADFCN